jgi:cation diffusion facilitator family transporter
MEKNNEQIAMRVARNTFAGNVILSAFKLFAGLFANSAAMISDAVHSLSDVLADIIVMVGIKMSNQKSDKEHPYGHERMECVAGIILAFILFSVGALIGWGGTQKIIAGSYETASVPGALALIAAIVSIVVKEAMYWYTRAAANKLNSVALKASAWHHRSDAMSSVGSFAGILGARLGFPILDAVACVIICAFILKVAFSIFKEAIDKMTDTACDDTLINEISAVALAQESVLGIDQIITRLFGSKVYVDMAIAANGDATLSEAHDVAQQVHDAIELQFPNVKHCMIHVNPVNVIDESSNGA